MTECILTETLGDDGRPLCNHEAALVAFVREHGTREETGHAIGGVTLPAYSFKTEDLPELRRIEEDLNRAHGGHDAAHVRDMRLAELFAWATEGK